MALVVMKKENKTQGREELIDLMIEVLKFTREMDIDNSIDGSILVQNTISTFSAILGVEIFTCLTKVLTMQEGLNDKQRAAIIVELANFKLMMTMGEIGEGGID